MTPKYSLRNQQKSVVFAGVLLFSLLLLLVQLWLFVILLERSLGGQDSPAWPAGTCAIVLLLVQCWMLAGVQRLMRAP